MRTLTISIFLASTTLAHAVDYKQVYLTRNDDVYRAGNTPVEVHARAGNDLLIAGNAPVIFHGNIGRDTIWLRGTSEGIGGPGADQFYVRRPINSVSANTNTTGNSGADYFSLTSIDDYRGSTPVNMWINDFDPSQGDKVRLQSYYTASDTILTSHQIFDALDINNDGILNAKDGQGGNGFYNLAVQHASLSLSWGYRSVTLQLAAVTRLARTSVAP